MENLGLINTLELKAVCDEAAAAVAAQLPEMFRQDFPEVPLGGALVFGVEIYDLNNPVSAELGAQPVFNFVTHYLFRPFPKDNTNYLGIADGKYAETNRTRRPSVSRGGIPEHKGESGWAGSQIISVTRGAYEVCFIDAFSGGSEAQDLELAKLFLNEVIEIIFVPAE